METFQENDPRLILAGSGGFVSHTGNTEYVLSFTGGVFDGLIACVVSSSRITNFFPGEALRANRVIESCDIAL